MAEMIGKRQRRKSLSVFSPSLTLSTPLRPAIHTRTPSDDTLTRDKKGRRNSSFFGRSHSPNRASDGSNNRRPGTAGSDTPVGIPSTPVMETPRPRRKSMQKKRTSVFGSLRSLHSWEDDETMSPSVGSMMDEQSMATPRNGIWSSAILHHGEVQTTGGMWRKKSHYLVLTDTHLIRFKNQGKAADVFACIPASYTRPAPSHRQSVASVSSLQDMQFMASGDSTAGIPLNSIIAVYMLEDARLSPSVEVAYLDERTNKATLVQMQTSDLQELNLWMVGIRQAAQMARANCPMPFSKGSIEYVTRMLEHERDYDPEVFRMFRVIQIASSKSITRSSSDDLTKLSPTGCYLAIGAHKLHLLPMQKTTNRSSVVSLSDWEAGTSFGLMNLTGLSMEYGDDSLHLIFRIPLKKSFNVFLASVHSVEIACWIRQHTEYLRPLWVRQPYEFVVPKELQNDDNFPPVALDEDYGCFDRTLVAYSASYDIDTSNIRYTIDQECEDAPCFRLLKPASPKTPRYNALELIAVMRALRYNEFFRSISFRGVNLDALQGLRDIHGVDSDVHLDRGGASVHIPGQTNLTVLSQEVRALALKSKWLRRLDFSYCLTRIPTPTLDKGTRDPGCGIPEAIFPVCRRELTSVDWVVLNGIKLGESDLDYLVDAASQRRSHLRALEVGDCGLSVHDLDLLLSTIVAQESTLEAINISGVQGRLNPDVLQQYIGYFGQIRKINLSRISRTSGTDPLITAEMLFNWRLEELALSRTVLNRETVDAIATYLASDRSRNLRVLRLDQCGLTGEDVAMFMQSMSSEPDSPRSLHLHVNENRIDNGCSHVFNAIANNQTPSHLSMRMIDFKKEDHFRELVDSLRKNSTLKFLDISKASLPYDASPETCRSLQVMLEENETLEALDISGDNAHLDVARFGIGLNLALTGLKKNTSLKVLRIEHQKLGLQGANTLASVLEENDTLREVHCENNDINLQSFTVLVNGLRCNRSLLTLSCMDRDRVLSLDKVRREVDNVRWEASNGNQSSGHSVRRSLYAAMTVGQGGQGHRLSKAPPPSVASALENSPFANHNVELVLQSLNERWDTEVSRLNRYLLRNYNIAHGIEEIDDDSASIGRPATAASLSTMFDNFKFDVSVSADEIRTPSLLDEPPAVIRLSEASDTPSQSSSYIESTSFQTRRISSNTRRPHTAAAAHFTPSSHSSSASLLALPVPAVPPAVKKAESVRSGRSSSSTASFSAGSTRSAYGVASSTLRGFLSGTALRERRRADAVRPSPVCVSDDKPPQLDWTPPKLDLGGL
ncbi:hypothetical protein DTO013E5_7672 [Penicillium roqueforti]|uniref:Pleckstrin homology domain n=1 Tax=Penicillium roqueforti (strain FM164) TaxID=1365484 RepID=W6QNK7_PENRF|nr:uncharacterized protein LCP9604111_9248 [Penicillium roqueforti]CDM37531.1 Pleckstrin homology domain [Penicillium roqueforti FM164]KAF9239016.1 hypothetical protein LCP9604111_9248 [Penicillium roqueforti]KAI1830080.1 hypothetical protein CBS147337_9132 [Penicillium roqueforti]KAI2670373.1 hypothetical protein CBS147355_9284 [Penicillium roqueforti]KAI2673873.1 hypothetical protein LCP963914a_8947 [Penicillium roqueforti]